MKTLLLTLALLLNSSLIASDYDYEITPVVGFNIPEGNLHLDNYTTYGAEFQCNKINSVIKPELSFLSSIADYKKNLLGYQDTADTSVFRVALNGVYEFDKIGSIIPLAKAGIGYENMDDPYAKNTNSVFLDAGAGIKVPLSENIALKLEAIYMLKDNHSRHDSNLAILAGLNIAFGKEAQAPAPVATKAVPTTVTTPTPEPVAAVVAVAPVAIDGDDDKDGVLNSADKCPKSPLNAAVDSKGCPIIINLHVNFAFDSSVVQNSANHDIEKFADFLITYPNYNANIVGHTDSTGPISYNQALSERRASAVKTILLSKGIDTSRISSSGEGENSPVASNDTQDNRQKNRRIEAQLIKQ